MRTVFAVSIAMLAGCTANPPSRVFACMRSGECPVGQRCLASEQRCVASDDPVWMSALATEAQPADGGTPAADGGRDAGAKVMNKPEASARDAAPAPPSDAGAGGMRGNVPPMGGSPAMMNTASDAGTPAADGGNVAPAPDAMIPPPTGDGISQDHALANWPMPSSAQGAHTAPSYTVMGATVLDNVTHLVWQRDTPATYPGCDSASGLLGQYCTWEEAKSYCASADVAAALGGDGWRLPTKIELESLIDESTFPGLDKVAFSGTRTDSYYWTSSRYVATTDNAWVVNADFADTVFVDVNRKTYRVRCVR